MLYDARFAAPRSVLLVHASSCASGLRVSGRSTFAGDVCALEDGTCSSGGCTIVDARFAVSRGVMFGARLLLCLWVARLDVGIWRFFLVNCFLF